VKRAVKYINEFLAPALCNQVNKGSDLRAGVEDDDGDVEIRFNTKAA
jgi:hypothetical protein